ncbi:MAG: trigger factor [Patescibacteria group bacterium]|nr:trigger factor [Patescibacteria group bacterium]
MKMEIKKQDNNRVEVELAMEWQEFAQCYQKALDNFVKNVVLDGFRQGKAPSDMVEKKIGEHKILEEAADLLLKEQYPEIIRKENLEVIGQPHVEILKLAKNNDFECRIKVDVLRDIDLPDLKKIVLSVAKSRAEVSDDDIKQTIKWIQKSRAKLTDKQGAASAGDWLEIEYQSPQIENSKLFQDNFVLGEGRFVAGFEDNLLDSAAGQEKEFSVKFPADFKQKETAGKDICFKVKVKAVKTMDLPKLSDEFARKLGKFRDLADLKNKVREGISQEKEAHAKEEWQEGVLRAIEGAIKIEAPDFLKEMEKQRMTDAAKHEAEHLQIDFEEFVCRSHKTIADFENDVSQKTEQKIKDYLVLRQIAKNQGIEAGDAEIEQEVNRLLASYPQLNPQEIDKEHIRGIILNEKVFGYLEKLSQQN